MHIHPGRLTYASWIESRPRCGRWHDRGAVLHRVASAGLSSAHTAPHRRSPPHVRHCSFYGRGCASGWPCISSDIFPSHPYGALQLHAGARRTGLLHRRSAGHASCAHSFRARRAAGSRSPPWSLGGGGCFALWPSRYRWLDLAVVAPGRSPSGVLTAAGVYLRGHARRLAQPAALFSQSHLAARVFAHAVLRFFGRYSYGMYIFFSIVARLRPSTCGRSYAPTEAHARAWRMFKIPAVLGVARSRLTTRAVDRKLQFLRDFATSKCRSSSDTLKDRFTNRSRHPRLSELANVVDGRRGDHRGGIEPASGAKRYTSLSIRHAYRSNLQQIRKVYNNKVAVEGLTLAYRAWNHVRPVGPQWIWQNEFHPHDDRHDRA